MMFLISFVGGSKSAEGGSNPPADLDRGVGPNPRGSKSTGTPAHKFTNHSRLSIKFTHQLLFWPYHKSTLCIKGDKFLKKPWCCVSGAV